MPTLYQPAPDRPAPPPGEEALRSRRMMRRIIGLGVASILFFPLQWVASKVVWRTCTGGDRQEAMNHLRQVWLSLAEFEEIYGRFPDSSTIPDVIDETKTVLPLDDTSSNKLFRQILADGTVRSEKPFWAKTAISPRKPDDDFRTDASALSPGECGFAYIAGLASTHDPAAPVALAPLLRGRTTFDREPFQGQAVVLFSDGVVRSLPIKKSGQVMYGGMDLFDSRQSFWKGRAPDIKWPE